MVISYDFKISSWNVQNQHFHILNAKFLRKQVSFYYKYHLVFHKNVLSRHCNLFVVFFLTKLFENLGVEHSWLCKPYSRCQDVPFAFPSCSCFCMEVLVEFIKKISVHDFGWKEISKSKVRRPVHLHFREVHNAHVNSQPKETLIGRVLFHAILKLAWWLPSVERSGSSLLPGS